MNAEELRSIQAPLKERYRSEAQAALVTLRARGRLGEGLTCKVETGKALVEAGKMSLEDLCDLEKHACPGDGACGFGVGDDGTCCKAADSSSSAARTSFRDR